MRHRSEVVLAWVLLVGSAVGFAVCMALWLANQISDRAMLGITLALSWFAITLTAMDYLKNSRIHRDQDDEDQR